LLFRVLGFVRPQQIQVEDISEMRVGMGLQCCDGMAFLHAVRVSTPLLRVLGRGWEGLRVRRLVGRGWRRAGGAVLNLWAGKAVIAGGGQDVDRGTHPPLEVLAVVVIGAVVVGAVVVAVVMVDMDDSCL